jgi:hypothetical protein
MFLDGDDLPAVFRCHGFSPDVIAIIDRRMDRRMVTSSMRERR